MILRFQQTLLSMLEDRWKLIYIPKTVEKGNMIDGEERCKLVFFSEGELV